MMTQHQRQRHHRACLMILTGLCAVVVAGAATGCRQQPPPKKLTRAEEARAMFAKWEQDLEKINPGWTKAREAAKTLTRELEAANPGWDKLGLDQNIKSPHVAYSFNQFSSDLSHDEQGQIVGLYIALPGKLLFSRAIPDPDEMNLILRDITPLAGLPLTYADLGGAISDLSALQGMPLETLKINNVAITPLHDLTPLAACPLRKLTLRNTQVADISPLKDMPLRMLVLEHSQVEDIAVLKGKPLDLLNLDDTNVSDLSALEGMKFTTITFKDTPAEKEWIVAGGMVKRITDCQKQPPEPPATSQKINLTEALSPAALHAFDEEIQKGNIHCSMRYGGGPTIKLPDGTTVIWATLRQLIAQLVEDKEVTLQDLLDGLGHEQAYIRQTCDFGIRIMAKPDINYIYQWELPPTDPQAILGRLLWADIVRTREPAGLEPETPRAPAQP